MNNNKVEQRIKLRKLRASFEEVWTAADRAWFARRNTCRCTTPVPGPRYFKQSHCQRCGHAIR